MEANPNCTHKLVIRLDTPQDQANALRGHQLEPLGFMLRIAGCKVQCPINSCRLCVSIVHDVVHVP